MLEVVVLYVILSQAPVRGNTREGEQRFCFDSLSSQSIKDEGQFKIDSLVGSVNIRDSKTKEFSTAPNVSYAPAELSDRFYRLADDWSVETGHVSSTKDLTSNSSYQEIIRLGWDVVLLLLKDLQENQRFWFPALYAITGVRPFDPSDAGNSKRMVQAWIKWGNMKGLT
jgi:hypothetical protein